MKIAKLFSGLGIGFGIGTCFGVSTNNMAMGLLMGLGMGLCYATSFGAFKEEDKKWVENSLLIWHEKYHECLDTILAISIIFDKLWVNDGGTICVNVV